MVHLLLKKLSPKGFIHEPVYRASNLPCTLQCIRTSNSYEFLAHTIHYLESTPFSRVNLAVNFFKVCNFRCGKTRSVTFQADKIRIVTSKCSNLGQINGLIFPEITTV